jgi:heme exporter protein C
MIAGLAWWKYLCIALMYYTLLAGLLLPVPKLDILHESIRNLYYHVPMWFGMTILLGGSLFHSLRFLAKGRLDDDQRAASLVVVAVTFGLAGLLTGMQWARVTWGSWWNNDPKQTGAAIGMLMYLAYLVLRGAIDDVDRKARVAAVANVIFFAVYVPMIFVVPRLTDSLHPGSGGNPGFNSYDLDGSMRIIFYPAVLGWTMLGFWLADVAFKRRQLDLRLKFNG